MLVAHSSIFTLNNGGTNIGAKRGEGSVKDLRPREEGFGEGLRWGLPRSQQDNENNDEGMNLPGVLSWLLMGTIGKIWVFYPLMADAQNSGHGHDMMVTPVDNHFVVSRAA